MATLSGTHTVDGAAPAADRFKVYAYNYHNRDISNASSLAGSSTIAGDGTWSMAVAEAQLHECIVIDTSYIGVTYAGTWSALSGSLDEPAYVLHDGTYWLLLVNLADVTTSEPSESNSDWQGIKAPVLFEEAAA